MQTHKNHQNQTNKNLVDWVYGINSQTPPTIIYKRLKELPIEDAVNIIRFTRNRRKGLGERDLSIYLVRMLYFQYCNDKTKKQVIFDLIKEFPTYGRWKDLFELSTISNEVREYVYIIYAKQLQNDLERMSSQLPISLAAKWAPNENSALDKSMNAAKCLATMLGVNMADYRKKYLKPLRKYLKIYETTNSSNSSNTQIPTQTKLRNRHKLSANSFLWSEKTDHYYYTPPFPKDILNLMLKDEESNEILEQEWDRMVEYYRNQIGILQNTLIVADPYYLDSIGIGLTLIDLLNEPFADQMLLLYENPEFVNIHDTSVYAFVHDLYKKMENKVLSKDPMWTEQQIQNAVITLIKKYKQFSLQQSDVPEMIVFITNSIKQPSLIQWIRCHFDINGYVCPEIVFWNVGSDMPTSIPAPIYQKGIGFLSGKSIAPFVNVINTKRRYGFIDPITVANTIVNNCR